MKVTYKNILLTGAVVTGVLGTTLLSANKASARMIQSHLDRPLQVVEGDGTQVRKHVSLPGTLITDNNWNTDFAVPGNSNFQRYETIITPQKNAKYNIRVNLKYSDDTYDEAYNARGVHLHKGEPLIITAAPRSNMTPYQINVNVGDLSSLGNPYTVKVVGMQ
jgi:hypothetical protein